jgi:hypothetical protein
LQAGGATATSGSGIGFLAKKEWIQTGRKSEFRGNGKDPEGSHHPTRTTRKACHATPFRGKKPFGVGHVGFLSFLEPLLVPVLPPASGGLFLSSLHFIPARPHDDAGNPGEFFLDLFSFCPVKIPHRHRPVPVS